MIGEAKYKEILDSGLILDHYFLLCQIKTGQKLVASRRILGFTNLLTKKGYLDDGKLTQKALDFIQIYEAPSIIKKEYFHETIYQLVIGLLRFTRSVKIS